MIKITIRTFITLILYIFSLPALCANEKASDYREWINLSQEELLKKGNEYLDKEQYYDALMFFTLACRECEDENDLDRDFNMCCEAYYKKWFILFSYNFDYSSAYRSIKTAIRLRDESKIYYPKADIGMAIFYHILYMQSKSKDLEYKAIEYCSNAYKTSLKKKDRRIMGISIVNLMIMESNLRDLSVINELWPSYESSNDDTFDYRYNALFFKYLQLWDCKKYKEAVPVALEMYNLSEKNNDWRRMFTAQMSVYRVYRDLGDFTTALIYILKNEKLAMDKGLREDALQLCEIKSELYSLLGKQNESEHYKMLYLLKKDSLLNFKQMENLNKIAFDDQIKDIEAELAKTTYQKNANNKILFFVVIFSIILLILLVVLYLKIIELKKTNIKIYENSLQGLEYDHLKQEYLKSQVKNSETKEKDILKVMGEDEDSLTTKEKYKTTKMSELEKKILLEKILEVMNNLDEICSVSFSGKRLAELTGTSYNYVSLVINENYNCDFNNFLNKFRIQEACRRFSDEENYGNFTIEAISESLGFKSKTTLVNSFKKIIGLTPSQYRKIVREKAK